MQVFIGYLAVSVCLNSGVAKPLPKLRPNRNRPRAVPHCCAGPRPLDLTVGPQPAAGKICLPLPAELYTSR